jgi:hypothetical protein
MTDRAGDALEVLRSVWSVTDQDADSLDELCGPVKPCRNMQHVSFDGLAEPGTDVGTAWRERLRREGKWSDGASIRDLVLGPDGASADSDDRQE